MSEKIQCIIILVVPIIGILIGCGVELIVFWWEDRKNGRKNKI